jgi:hypothetical protein
MDQRATGVRCKPLMTACSQGSGGKSHTIVLKEARLKRRTPSTRRLPQYSDDECSGDLPPEGRAQSSLESTRRAALPAREQCSRKSGHYPQRSRARRRDGDPSP